MRIIEVMIVITLYIFMTSCNRPIYKEKQLELVNETNSPDSNVERQISQVVRTIFQDSKGRIWFGTQNGAFKLDGTSLTHIDSIQSELGKGITIKEIAEDKEGRIWFGHTDGISSIDKGKVRNYYESDGLISNDVWCISTDQSNHVWIGTIEGVCEFDGRDFTPFEIPEGKINTSLGVSSRRMVHDIMEDSDGRIWFSTNGGVYIKEEDRLTNISEQDGLKTNFINQVIEARDGSFWISTSKGLFHYIDQKLHDITEGVTADFKGTGSVIEDSNGNIWFNSNLRDIYFFDGEGFTKYRIAEGDYAPAPFQIYEDQDKRLWFVGFGGAYRYENEQFVNVKENGPF